ncbi:prolyl oligopeptidase family serine peptidase [Massilia sp. PAMC28688]|uniref:alpha/beta hydrolase family protein n=1 Tax=Massilia sp. PAMC28688 TaxID=2861283 RepID=UPI001C634B57|nr:alpha/beta fold hydrolase [Massilia sp. PAMC28688]QYF91785.1 prolyl oligopeptidase family serine peptidase [Massilia sp. PAMC28688]
MPSPLYLTLCRCTAALLATASLMLPVQAATAPPIEHFFSNARFSRPALSPNGKFLAIVVGTPGKRDALRVIDLATNKVHATASFGDADINAFQWVNDQRLIYNVTDHQQAQGEVTHNPGLYAANIDGSAMRQLAARQHQYSTGTRTGGRMLSPYTFMTSQPGLQNADSVYVQTTEFGNRDRMHTQLLLLNTVTGFWSRVKGPEHARSWLLDHEGEPRVAIAFKEQNQLIYLRQRETDEWKEIASFNAFIGGQGSIDPLAFGADGTLYVLAGKDRDTRAVHAYDTATGKLSDEPLIETTGYDFNGGLIMNKGVLQGFRFITDALSTHWIDPRMKALQAEIDQKLGDTINTITRPRRPESDWVLVEAFSDVRPRSFLLYNTASKAFRMIGNSHPEIVPEQMGRQDAVSYKARDGLTIPALLTLPAGKRSKLPMVVLVHGGPYVRGSVWGWDPTSQFLASRGYAVLEPSFRGTTGLGAKHYRAGWRQWGLAMQDDLADGAKWAIEQGIADGKRICIAGASYGGYATLMGLIKDPDLFKCGINWVGVTDISLIHNGHWSFENDTSDQYRKYGMPTLIGDVVKDAEQLKATSPLVHAARIKQPLLLAYGGADRRVPQYHGNKFYEAVKHTNPNVEWVVYPNEGHGFVLPENRIDFFTRMEKFLTRTIGQTP